MVIVIGNNFSLNARSKRPTMGDAKIRNYSQENKIESTSKYISSRVEVVIVFTSQPNTDDYIHRFHIWELGSSYCARHPSLVQCARGEIRATLRPLRFSMFPPPNGSSESLRRKD